MNQQKIDEIVSHLDYLISELKHLKSKIKIEEGIHFNIISDEMFAIEIWDTDGFEPRILSYVKNQNDIDKSKPLDHIKECMVALNTLDLRAFKKQIYWNSDISWDDLPENFRKLDQVYKIEKRELSKSLRTEVKERINALYCMSK